MTINVDGVEKGKFVLGLYGKVVPKTVGNYLYLSKINK